MLDVQTGGEEDAQKKEQHMICLGHLTEHQLAVADVVRGQCFSCFSLKKKKEKKKKQKNLPVKGNSRG
jgi:hypothetical protein